MWKRRRKTRDTTEIARPGAWWISDYVALSIKLYGDMSHAFDLLERDIKEGLLKGQRKRYPGKGGSICQDARLIERK